MSLGQSIGESKRIYRWLGYDFRRISFSLSMVYPPQTSCAEFMFLINANSNRKTNLDIQDDQDHHILSILSIYVNFDFLRYKR